MHRSVCAVLATCFLAVAAPAAAEDEDPEKRVLAQQLFDEAEALLGAKKVAEACPKYAESYRLDPHLGVLIYLAECYEHNGQLASAWGAFREAEGMAIARKDQRVSYARDRVEALTPRLSRLTVSVPAETRVEGLVLYRNGLELAAASWGTPTPTDAGSYVLEARAPGRRNWTTNVVVPPEGGSVTVTVPELAPGTNELLPVTPAPARTKPAPPTGAASPSPAAAVPPPVVAQTAPPPPAGDTTEPSRRVVGLAVGGLGVVGLGVGSVLALGAKSKFDDSAPSCNGAGYCTPEGTALRDSAQSKAMVATVVTGVGAAAVVTGVVLWLTAPSSHSAAVTKTSAWSVVPATTGWGLGAHHAF